MRCSPVVWVAASASTATAPCSWTITGLSSSSSRPALEQQLAGARGEPRGGGDVERRAAARAGEQRRAAQAAQRALDALGVAGSGTTRDVVERLGPDAAEADDEHRHDAVARARRRAAPRPAAPSARRARVASTPVGQRAAARTRGARASLGEVDVSTTRRARSCAAAPAPRASARPGRRARRHAATASSASSATRPSGTGDAGRAQQRLGLVLGEPAPRRPCATARASRDRGDPLRVRRRRGERRSTRSPVRSPATRGDAVRDQAGGDVVVEQLGQRRGDARPARRLAAPRAHARRARPPTTPRRAVEPVALVVAARARGRSPGRRRARATSARSAVGLVPEQRV